MILLDLAAAGAPAAGMHEVGVLAEGVHSAATPFRVAGPAAALLDAPADAVHDASTDLVLTGQGLTAADAAFAWPADGIRAPDDVVPLALSAVSAGGATLPSASAGPLSGLAAVAARGSTWRVALRILGGGFTPFIRLELSA